jgi:exodeoxyribonuclease VII large subunit
MFMDVPLICLALVLRRSKLCESRGKELEMMDLIDDPAEGANAPEFSVTELSSAIKRVIVGEFGIVRI